MREYVIFIMLVDSEVWLIGRESGIRLPRQKTYAQFGERLDFSATGPGYSYFAFLACATFSFGEMLDNSNPNKSFDDSLERDPQTPSQCSQTSDNSH